MITMTAAAAVLRLMLALPPWHGDREMSTEARETMLRPVATAIHGACEEPPGLWTPRRCKAALLAVGHHETHFAAYVVEGRCEDGPRGQRCDPDPHTKKPRARGVFQLWRRACPAAHAFEPGDPRSLGVEARCVVSRLTGAYYRCRGRHEAGDWAGAFAGYRSIDCSHKPSAIRVRTMFRFESILWRMSQSQEGGGS